MLDATRLKAVDFLAAKLGTIFANAVTITSFAIYVSERSSSLPRVPGIDSLNVVIHLALLSAIAYGVLWSVAERIFGWNYGAGGNNDFPYGWSAVVLSLTVTLPITIVPYLYERLTKVAVLQPLHWRGALFAVGCGVAAHLLMYGTSGGKDRNGLRNAIMPLQEHTPLGRAVMMELVYAVGFFGLIVLPYRLVVAPEGALLEAVLGRTILPSLVFFTGMVVFIGLRYPASTDDPRWMQARGLVGGLLMMFALCGGMYL